MNCQQMDELFDRGSNAGMPEAARHHLSECPRCRAVFETLTGDSGVSAISSALRARIHRSLSASLHPVKRLPSSRVTVLSLLAVFTVLVSVMLSLMGTAGAAGMTSLQFAVMTVLLAGGTVLFPFSLSGQMRPGSRQRLGALRSLAILGAACLAMMAAGFPWRPLQSFLAEGWPCLTAGLAMAAAAAFLLGFIVHRGAPVSPHTTGATLGAAAAWLGVTVLQFKCPHQEAPHLLVWHAGVLFVAAATGLGLAHLARNFRPPSREVV